MYLRYVFPALKQILRGNRRRLLVVDDFEQLVVESRFSTWADRWSNKLYLSGSRYSMASMLLAELTHIPITLKLWFRRPVFMFEEYLSDRKYRKRLRGTNA